MYLHRYELVNGRVRFLISDEESPTLAACKRYLPYPDKPDHDGWLIFDAALHQDAENVGQGDEDDLKVVKRELEAALKRGE